MKKIIITIVACVFSFAVTAQNFYDIENINTIEITFEESNWDAILDNYAQAGDEERLLGVATINGEVFDSVGVRYKGNSSYNANNSKNPLNIKLDYIIDDQELDGYGTLKLSNGYKDPSFVREVLSYEIARKYMPAPLSNYAKVYVNGTFLGLYTSNQDVDKTFMRTHFGVDDRIRLKGELADGVSLNDYGVWTYMGTDSLPYMDVFELQSDYGWLKFINFLDTLNNHSGYVDEHLNIDRHLWFLAFENLFVNLDGPLNNQQNHYIYEDATGRFNPIPWDLNECFGVFGMLSTGGHLSPPDMVQMSPYLNADNSEYPILSNILSNEEYKKIYVAHMKTIIEENISNSWYETRAEELQDIIADDYQNDPNTFFTYSEMLDNINNTVGTPGPPPNIMTIGLTELMDDRADYLLDLDDFMAQAPELTNEYCSEDVSLFDEIIFRVDAEYETEVYLGYRFDYFANFEKIQLYDDGSHNDGSAGDGIYGNSIMANSNNIQYYFVALNAAAATFLPKRAEYEFFEVNLVGDIVINEFMADNETTVTDQDEEYEDWIELYNNTESDINLAGYYLSDDASNQQKWNFPDVTIYANDYLIVWCDNDVEQEGLHSNFKLSKSGETIILSDADLNIIDQITYSEQSEDTTAGRYPNGTGIFIEMLPTFGAENQNNITRVYDTMAGFNVYPNPTSSFLYIDFLEEIPNYSTIIIANLKGQIIYREELNATDKVEIDVSSFEYGLYIFSIDIGNKNVNGKFIKK